MKEIFVVDVFISCPSDVRPARRKCETVALELNIACRRNNDPFRFEVIHCDNMAASAIGASGQGVIEAQIGQYDLYVGIMGARFGTSVDGFGSGTEKEFLSAVECYHNGTCKNVSFLFQDKNLRASTTKNDQLDQLKKVSEFKDMVRSSGVLTKDCPREADVSKEFRSTLEHVLSELRRQIRPDSMASIALKGMFT